MERPTARYSDVGGVEEVLQEVSNPSIARCHICKPRCANHCDARPKVRQLIEYPLSHGEIYKHLGVDYNVHDDFQVDNDMCKIM